MNAPVASASRSVARVATRSTRRIAVNDSMAFHPTSKPTTQTTSASESFAFFPSNGVNSRIPRAQSQNPPALKQIAETPTSKYSSAELEKIFAESRLRAATTKNSNTTTIPKDSYSVAFHPAKQQTSRGVTANTTQEASFGFYPSQGIAQRKPFASKPKATAQQQQQQQQQAESDKTSLLAIGSLMLGAVGVQARRSVARA